MCVCVCVCDAAIAEDPDVRQLILELKGQRSSPAIVGGGDGVAVVEEEEGFMPRGRRMSVKRITQQAKEEMAKQSIEAEASMRRTSMAQYVSHAILYQILPPLLPCALMVK